MIHVKPKVLVADDDLGTRETFQVILGLNNCEVTTAATAHDARAVAQTEVVDVALIDVHLPDMSGVELLRSFRGGGLAMPCIMITGFASTSTAVASIKLGAVDYLEKPIVEDDLMRAVQEAIGYPSKEVQRMASAPFGGPLVNRSKPHGADWRVTATLRLIEQRHRDHDLTLATAAQHVDVSVEHLCRILKRATGRGFGTHLHRARVQGAKHLLTSTNLAVKEIAYLAGYRTTGKLDHYFKRFCGTRPTTFREMVRNTATVVDFLPAASLD